jgi:NAD(P)H-dependent FMN reductase
VSDQVLLVSGSLRDGSTNTALLRTARLLAPPGVTAVLYEGLARLPHFNPDDDQPPLHPEVAALRAAVRAADAILFCTPEYAGALPGALKNMLEWMIGDDRPGSIYGKRVAWVNVSSAATGAADAHESLRKVVGYAHADVVGEACAAIPVTRRDVADGTISDPAIRDRIVKVLTALLALQREVKRRGHGEDSIYFAAAKNRYIGVVSLGFGPNGKRLRRKVSGKIKQEVRDKFRALRAELDAGLQPAAGYTVQAAVDDWLGGRPLRKLSTADVRSALSGLSLTLSGILVFG